MHQLTFLYIKNKKKILILNRVLVPLMECTQKCLKQALNGQVQRCDKSIDDF